MLILKAFGVVIASILALSTIVAIFATIPPALGLILLTLLIIGWLTLMTMMALAA